MTRTSTLAASVLLAIFVVQLPGRAQGQARRRPNVLVIVTDDQRATDTMRGMGSTRRIFFRKGTRFTNAVATTPRCCPARASIFTGQYAHNHGVKGNAGIGNLDQTHTLQRYLTENGYRSAIYGKFANGWPVSRDPPYFEKWAISSSGSDNRYRNGKWNVNGEARIVETYATEYVQQKAVRFLRQAEVHDRKPWFLYLTPPAPHLPATAQRRYADRLYPAWEGNPAIREDGRRDKPPYVRRIPPTTFSRGREIRLKQLRSLESVDDLVQRVFRTLKRKRENRRTLAIFVSDNGFMWGEHRLSEKLHPYTQSIEIPFAIRWPGRVRRGIRTPKPVANIDVAPTILDAAGINPQHVVDGRSLLKSWRRRRLLLEHWKQGTSVPSWKSLRTRRLQYIEYFDSEGRRTFREYYNLRRDPWQLRNLLRDGKKRSGPSRSRLLRLHVHLKRAADCSGAGCP